MNDLLDNSKNQQAMRVAYLVGGFIRSTLTEAEQSELDDWVAASDENMQLFEELTDEANGFYKTAMLKDYDTELTLIRIRKSLSPADVKIRPSKRFSPLLWPVAILVLTSVAALLYLLTRKDTSETNGQPSNEIVKPFSATTLSVGEGKSVALDAATDTVLQTSGGTKVVVRSGEIIYSTALETGNSTKQNLVTGSQSFFRVVFPEGSEMHVNAGTTIQYPSELKGPELQFDLDGEAHFAFNPQAGRKVSIHTAGMEIVVTGTRFNVKAYRADSLSSILLLQGAISLRVGDSVGTLRPMQFAVIDRRKHLVISSARDTLATTGWMNNEFRFVDAPVPVVLAELERWYGTEFKLTEPLDAKINGTFSRRMGLKEILQMLEKAAGIRFRQSDSTIVVSRD
jgi:transmembrane sensor